MGRITKIGPKSTGRRFPAMAAVLATFITTGVAFTRVPAQGAASAGGNPDITVAMLAIFRLDRIPLAGTRPWVEAQILPFHQGRAAPRVPATNVLRAHILARLRGAPVKLPQHVLLTRPLFIGWVSPPRYALIPQTANLGVRFPPGQLFVAPLGRPVKVGSPPHQRLAYPIGFPHYDIPAGYAVQLAPAWSFYVTHRDMFGPKLPGTNEKALLGLLTGKNIFLAQEAWRVLLGATTQHHTVSVSPICAPLTEKFVRKLLSKLSPDRQALFIYEALHQGEVSENAYLIAAVRAAQRLVGTATTASQLLPPATACTYFFAWRVPSSPHPARQYGGYLGVAHSMLEEIRKKITRFGTHTASGRRITQLLKMDHLSAQERR